MTVFLLKLIWEYEIVSNFLKSKFISMLNYLGLDSFIVVDLYCSRFSRLIVDLQ